MSRYFSEYASKPEFSRGRFYKESISFYSNVFEEDYNRVIRSNIFKRLQNKTQVIVCNDHDHYRNRLTHSIEVASIARFLASQLNLASYLSETIAICHDMGHAPFGHAGEAALKSCMEERGGFCHNAYVIKLVTSLEERYIDFNGLNLTWETIEGIAKHNGILNGTVSPIIIEYNSSKQDLRLDAYPSLEAQISSLADDIAYNAHDIEDGIRSKIINLDHLSTVPIVNPIIVGIKQKCPNAHPNRVAFEITRELTKLLCKDALRQTKDNISFLGISTVDDIRKAKIQVGNFSDFMIEQLSKLKLFLYDNFYKHAKVLELTNYGQQIIRSLFQFYVNNIQLMPESWQKKIDQGEEIKEVVAYYIAGMTDRYAIAQFTKLIKSK